MNKNILLLIFSFLVLISCSRNNNDENATAYYLSFKLDGNIIKHSYPTYSSLKPNATIPGTYDFQLSSNSNDHKNNIVFSIHKPGSISTGTFTTTDNSVIDVSYTLFNNLNIDKIYSVHTTGQLPVPFSITLTEITNGYFKGSFNGTYLYTDDRSDSIRVTDGEFFVRRHN